MAASGGSNSGNGADDTRGRGLQRLRLTARGWLGTVADLLAVVGACFSVWTLVKGPLPQVVLAGLLGLLTLAFMGLSFQLQRQQAKDLTDARLRARHSESLSYMQDAASALRNAVTALAVGQAPAGFAEPAARAASCLATAMTLATGQKCRVVVKIIFSPEGSDDSAVKTFATSEPAPPVRSAPALTDWVKQNTDFDEIFYRNRDFFLSNDLSKEQGYINSHLSRERLQQDGYPYLSTIVWPIYGYAGTEVKFEGFLCVDTAEAGAFDQERDLVVGQTMASFWFLALRAYSQAVEEAARGSLAN